MVFKDYSQREKFAEKFIRESETLKLSISNLTKGDLKVGEVRSKM
jgi:hypothetical protein